jgi:hypothetical protein
VHTERAILVAARLAVGLVVAVFVTGALAPAFAATPPHVVLESQRANTDACAICHRAHAANAVVPYRMFESAEMTGSSLVLSTDPASGDVQLCFACHGQGQLGSNKDIQTNYLKTSVHALAPATAPYGPSPLYCSTCHDSHGSARVTTDVPYPRLLRSFEGTTPVFTGEAYCATCHTAAAATAMGERFASLEVYLTTGHYSGLSTPTSGTGIRCSWCHEPHGSAVAPLLVASIVPTAVPTTFTVTADNRTFCIACHVPASATWEGSATYAASGHGSSTATVSITATWVPAGSRRVGECQVCHAPMGRDDGTGHAIPKLLDAKGRVQCDSCHSSTGVAHSTDTSSQTYPVSESTAPELVAVYASDPATWTGRVSVYGRALSGADPRPLIGPKQYGAARGTGPSGAGDVDNDGKNELVVASATSAYVTVYASDPLTGLGLQPAICAIPTGLPAAALAVADVVDDIGPSQPELVIVTGDGSLCFYRVSGSVLETMAGPVDVGTTGPWGLATGDTTGTSLPDAVVTNRSAGTLTIATDNGLFGVTPTTGWAGLEPVAPAIGNVWSGPAVVVCDASAAATRTVRVFDGAAVLVPGAEYDVRSGAGLPSASAIGDVLWGVPVSAPGRSELAVAFSEASGDSSVVVIPQVASPGSGLDTAAAIESATGPGVHTGSLLAGDVEGDTHSELVVGNGGSPWTVAPSVQVWRSNGADLTADPTYLGGGTDLAGLAPSLVLADFGPVLPSRHPIDEIASAAHVSTEAAPFTRHVTCSDCHNTHEGNTAAGVAPAVPGPLAGARGIDFVGPVGRSTTEWGICFKCHSSYTALGGREDVAVTTDPGLMTSVHSIPYAAGSDVATATLKNAWTPTSILYCTDCHGNSAVVGDQASGPHTSGSSPILVGTYEGVPSTDPDLLCYDCHLDTVYATGAADGAGMSWFLEDDGAGGWIKLHSLHVNAPSSGGNGISCGACHVSHGSADNPALLRDGIGFLKTGDHAGSCDNKCHTANPRSWPVP